ncbi:MAG: hypothetical protein K2X38_19430 [Gemmataceae bacterium]|nr:hypothetical protein [Gemmataceae bacterium]
MAKRWNRNRSPEWVRVAKGRVGGERDSRCLAQEYRARRPFAFADQCSGQEGSVDQGLMPRAHKGGNSLLAPIGKEVKSKSPDLQV